MIQLSYPHHVNTSTNSSLNGVGIVSVRRISDAVNAFPVRNHKTLFSEELQSDYVAEEIYKQKNLQPL